MQPGLTVRAAGAATLGKCGQSRTGASASGQKGHRPGFAGKVKTTHNVRKDPFKDGQGKMGFSMANVK